ncbi:MAG: glycosyltransferase [Planctomycetes bacterium]|nr:glycosyltransferase [Planctomycetota bacterium]
MVLFSYIIDGFILEPGSPIPNKHTNYWQSVRMAKTFVELGYEVDVIHWTNDRFIPEKNYSFFVDVRHNMERLAPLLTKDCVKIMHFDVAHILFHNTAEVKRLLQLQQRRGVTLQPRRFENLNFGIEHADYVTTVGNDFVVDTLKYAKKKIYRLPSPCVIMLDWQKKVWGQCRKHFLWFSSGGLVHKGLDLALEAFREMPDCHLTVCAPVEREKDFVRAYHEELYETSNITTVGLIDVDSSKFREITANCSAMVNLSCSEGGGASVKTCMHAGLIPIVSYESGVDVHDFGVLLKSCSISNIKNAITHIATLPQNELEERARKAWEFARQYYTRGNFTKEYRKVILEIVADSPRPKEMSTVIRTGL